MLTEFENKVAGFIRDNELLGPADKVLLAVSGGADSMALLYTVCALRSEGVLSGDCLCAHINHQLRGSESDGDEDFVVAQSHTLNLPIVTKRLDVREFARKNKLSIETAARKLRIETLLDIAEADNCNFIATAHQKNDNAETVLQRLARGTGFRGLGGIWPVRRFTDSKVKFVRPLLCVSRDEIIKYLQQRNLKWRKDHTNEDCTYRRNYIRHKLIPALQQDCRDSIVEQLFDLSQSAQRFYNLICSSAETIWGQLADCSGDKVALDLNEFSGQPRPVKVELIRRALITIGSGERDLTQGHYERILQLAEHNISNRRIELPGSFIVRREYGKLFFTHLLKKEPLKEQLGESKELEVPGQTRFGEQLITAKVLDAEEDAEEKVLEKLKAKRSKYVECFDLDKVRLPLVVRLRRPGDKFWPLGLPAEKKVGKFLTAAKVPQELRRKLLIVTDTEKIIWVWPIRICEHARLTARTKKILQLRIVDSR